MNNKIFLWLKESSPMASDEPPPSWIDPENDDSHKAEIAPLFGTGKIALQDREYEDEIEASDEDDVILQPKSYGAIGDHDDEDPYIEETVITAVSNESSKSGKASRRKSKPKPRVSKIVVTESGKPEMPRRNCLMGVFKFIETIGAVGSLALMASQVIPLIVVSWDEIGLASLCLKIYVSLFCVLFLLVEMDVPISFLRNAAFLQTYVSASNEDGLAPTQTNLIEHQSLHTVLSGFSIFLHWIISFRRGVLRTSG